jgi:type I restriction-modification system DNA methylase subunit
VRGIGSDIRWNSEGSFHKDGLRDLKADFILANPPFDISDWGGDRRGQVLFIDARKPGHLVDRTRRELSDADIQRMADACHAWRRVPETVWTAQMVKEIVRAYPDAEKRTILPNMGVG